MSDRVHLRVRIRDEMIGSPRRRRAIEVLDVEGNVLGDLARSVSEIRWVATGSGPATVSIDLAAERASIDSLEVPGYNAPWAA